MRLLLEKMTKVARGFACVKIRIQLHNGRYRCEILYEATDQVYTVYTIRAVLEKLLLSPLMCAKGGMAMDCVEPFSLKQNNCKRVCVIP